MKRVRTLEFDDDDKRKEWNTPSRVRIKQLRLEGNSTSDICCKTWVPKSSQYTFYKSGSSRRSGKTRSGRPTKLGQDTIEKMIKALKGHYNHRI